MKWLSFCCLLVVALAMGCSSQPAGTAGDANDPALTSDLEPVDAAAEEAAANTAAE